MDLQTWVASLANSQSPQAALFFMAMSESIFFPVPPDLLLILLCLVNPLAGFYYALLCTIGSTIGGVIGYLLGRKYGRPLVYRFISKEKFHNVEFLFNKYGVLAVGIAGFTPIPYKIFTITSGIFELSIYKFSLVSALTRGARFFIVATSIYFFGDQARKLLMNNFNTFTLIVGIILILSFFLIHLWHKNQNNMDTDTIPKGE